MSDDYGFINARLRGMKGGLLTSEDLQKFTAQASLDDLVVLLDTTAYALEIELAMTVRKGIAGVDEGLRRNLEHTLAKVYRMTDGHPRRLIDILMGYWESYDIKTILRGKHSNSTLDAILAAIFPAGLLDELTLRELASQSNIKGVIDLMTQWHLPWAGVLRQSFDKYREHEELHFLESAVDRAYFTQALSALDPQDGNDALVMDFIRHHIDMLLIGYALKSVHYRSSVSTADEIFIPGGHKINYARFKAMIACREIDQLIQSIDIPYYAACLEAGVPRYLQHRHLTEMERALEACFFRFAHKKIWHDPLSIGVAIAFIWMKVNEVVNLRLIARGIHTSMPKPEIEQHLIKV